MQKQIIISAIAAVVVLGGLFVLSQVSSTDGTAQVLSATKQSTYDEIAQCLTKKGVIFYGAFWCPHCHAQKQAFGTAVQYLPYHECSQPSGQGQLQSCVDAGIQQYPTWVFPDGSRLTGEQDPETLAAKAGCTIDGVAASSTSATSTTASSSSAS